jgi:hypothetical protein
VSRAKRYLTWGLGLGVPVVLAVTVAMAVGYSPPQRVEAATPTPSRPPVPTPEPAHQWPAFETYPLPEFGRGSPVGPAADALRVAGATVYVIDARGWEREVRPDWALCTQSETFWGESDIPTGDVTLAAVPVGDPCP